MQNEHILKFTLEGRRISNGLRPKYLVELVDEVLLCTEDTALSAILADLPIMTESDFLRTVLEYIDKSFEFEFDTEKLDRQIEAEKIKMLCSRYLPQIEHLYELVLESLASKINYTDMTKKLYPQFEPMFEVLTEEFSMHSYEKGTPWFVDSFGSVVCEMDMMNHLGYEVANGVHQWSPVWEDRLPELINQFRTIVEGLEKESSLYLDES